MVAAERPMPTPKPRRRRVAGWPVNNLKDIVFVLLVYLVIEGVGESDLEGFMVGYALLGR